MSVNAPLNRKLRMGLVGGGQGAFIGKVHSIAATLDNRAALVAGALSSDPARAKESVRLVRGQSTAVLEDLRRLVGLLRTDTDATRAVHSLEGLPELVATTRAAGTPVELQVLVADGARLGDRLGPIAQLAAYRIAWARVRGVPESRVRGAFFHAATGQTLWPDLPGTEEITRVLGAARPPGPHRRGAPPPEAGRHQSRPPEAPPSR